MMQPMLQRWYQQLTADRRKLAVVIVLLLIGLVLWGRMLLETGPSQATAQSGHETLTEPLPDPGSLKLSERDTGADADVIRLSLPERTPRDLFNTEALLPEQKEESATKSPDESADAEKESVDPSVLSLQSVMQGDNPRAMINGQVINVGEAIRGFTLKQVGQRWVIVEYEGETYRLTL